MEEHVDRLAQKALVDLRSKPPSERVIIGIAGVPGAGKTTLAAAVARRVNDLAAAPVAVALPMDGFHLPRAALARMGPDPAEAARRRGAAFTFDGDAFLALVRALAAPQPPAGESPGPGPGPALGPGPGPGTTIYAPSFAHEIKDPVPDAIAIPPAARVVLVEGNYCALDRPPWRDAARLMARLWYVDAPREVTHARLARRHLASGIVADEREAWERATGTDELNAEDIRRNLLEVDEVIPTS